MDASFWKPILGSAECRRDKDYQSTPSVARSVSTTYEGTTLKTYLTAYYVGKYSGSHAIERAFDDFKTGKLENNKTGIMVHYVIREVDQGQVIMTKEVECREGDDLQQLRERIQSHEHKLIVEATAHVVREITAGGR